MTLLSETDGGQNRGATALPSGSRPTDQALLHGPDASRVDPSRKLARGECKSCLGTGQWLLMRTWFMGDGFRRERCHICKGSGQSTAKNWMPEQAKFRRAEAAMRGAPKGLDNAALGRLGCAAMEQRA